MTEGNLKIASKILFKGAKFVGLQIITLYIFF